MQQPLQATVVDAEYVKQKYKDTGDSVEEGNGTRQVRQNKGGTAKRLVLDDEEGGFWDRVRRHVRMTLPIFKLLRRRE